MYLKVSTPHGAGAETLKQIQKHTQHCPGLEPIANALKV